MEYKTIEKGYIGQLIVEKQLIQHGWNLYKPILENGKVDLIIEKDNKYLRIQIKTIQQYGNSKIIPVRKISHNMGQYKTHFYTEDEIDYFIGVDVETEMMYILPIEFVKNIKSAISIRKILKYENNFEQLDQPST